MRIGMICPYSFDEPGGVQIHAIDLCTELIKRGHEVSLIGPGSDRSRVPNFVELGGKAIPIRYNGSVARLSFGPKTARHVDRWIADNNFDVLHIHEPNSPSYSMLALRRAEGPIVATYHASASSSHLLQLALPFLRPLLERIQGGIAVSEEARRWQVENLAGDPVLIPNGVATGMYRRAEPISGVDPTRPRIMFLGRFEESRKGLSILLDAMPAIVRQLPEVELVIAGGGSVDNLVARLNKVGLSHSVGLGPSEANVRVLGRVSDEDKARALTASDIYIAPNTGGESFGIVLVEAMAAGAAVVASDIPAFAAVGQDGHSARLFPNGDSAGLAAAVSDLLANPEKRCALAARGSQRSREFDWQTVTDKVEEVYSAVAAAGRKVIVR
ncbi:glycosyltransferase family 4 protein [Corynebacterium auriscanis]|uniref:GDP-mannose-dependent alpha-(1-2)-phosphatidylinositol mannosyltransferase n=1 Tax=Corynebacterium auriscanis TaxID=99807 RepID=A0A0A2DJV5_9CORY|nr:glycosyltransferase family 4 protein [Corynebacterium auriscanis]KGM19450.1 GDP-mannose-dependent alpha-(1-2)-phosphatidylinositol mannosyltransferase [Corynebacterium auriscanis]MCX2162936.1 glycosyltransferase family 4 protein [Corynebacterium auriscanis]WJY72796.1 GDP-mannose-dependent alpha-(1-2)-phosphatidylinositol mannosyltransferase [Corynebacterium auriscanis]